MEEEPVLLMNSRFFSVTLVLVGLLTLFGVLLLPLVFVVLIMWRIRKHEGIRIIRRSES